MKRWVVLFVTSGAFFWGAESAWSQGIGAVSDAEALRDIAGESARTVFVPTFQLGATAALAGPLNFSDVLDLGPHFELEGLFRIGNFWVGPSLAFSWHGFLNDSGVANTLGAGGMLVFTPSVRALFRFRISSWFDLTFKGLFGYSLGRYEFVELADVGDIRGLTWDAGLDAGITFFGSQRVSVGVALRAFHGSSSDPIAAVTAHVGYGVYFGSFVVPPIEIDLPELPTFYPAKYQSYLDEHDITITVTNTSDRLTYESVQAVVDIPGLTNRPLPGPQIARLEPGETRRLPVLLALTNDVLAQRDDVTLSVEVILSYRTEQEQFSKAISSRVPVLKANSINWSRTAHLGSFLTYQDPLIERFARNAIALASPDQPYTTLTRAIAVYDALVVHGLVYNRDPETPFNAVSSGEAIDTVQFPRQMLANRVGDCDDLVTLYASLLQNLSINAALVTIPGHIFMMFDSGLSESEAWMLGADPTKFQLRDGKIWIPVEVTMLDRGFLAAWEKGAEQLAEHAGEELEIIDVSDVVSDYLPATPSEASVWPPVDPSSLKTRFSRSVDRVHTRILESSRENWLLPQQSNVGALRFKLLDLSLELSFGDPAQAGLMADAILLEEPNNPLAISAKAVAIQVADGDEASLHYLVDEAKRQDSALIWERAEALARSSNLMSLFNSLRQTESTTESDETVEIEESPPEPELEDSLESDMEESA